MMNKNNIVSDEIRLVGVAASIVVVVPDTAIASGVNNENRNGGQTEKSPTTSYGEVTMNLYADGKNSWMYTPAEMG
jgi:hypothetical protein